MKKSSTIADVVRLTGLSRATVDRVINGRSNVSEKTRKRVEDAVNELRYSTNKLASLMVTEMRTIEVILPEGRNPFFAELRHCVQTAAADAPAASVTLRGIDPYRPETLLAELGQLSDTTDAIITVGIDNPEVAACFDHIASTGVRVVTLVSGFSATNAAHYVGQNNFQAGRTAGRLMTELLTGQQGAVAILVGHLQFRHLLDRRSGFEQFLDLNLPDVLPVHVRPYGNNAAGFEDVLKQLLAKHPDLIGIYLCGGGQPEIFDAVRDLAPQLKFVTHEVTASSRKALADGTVNFIVASDMDDIGRVAVRTALAEREVTPPATRTLVYVIDNLPPERAEGATKVS